MGDKTKKLTENHTQRAKLCNIAFLCKAVIAFAFGVYGLAANAQKVIELHDIAISKVNRMLKPVTIVAGQCPNPSGGIARLEPPENTVMIGFHYDWITDQPVNVAERLGFSPAISNAYLDMFSTRQPSFNTSLFEWHAQEVQRIGGILAMTMQPNNINSISDEMITELTDICLLTNTKYGVPVFLRFGHEMNGDWPSYGMRPTAFISAFRRIARSIHSKTNMTAMVFGPNIGITYPFVNTPGALSGPPTLSDRPEDFALLDTNRDGIISNLDDPYMPYYPGDEFVDWVALSIYWYPDTVTGFNRIPPGTYYQDMITSTGPSMALVDESKNGDPLRNFYQRLVVEHGKPMMIPETAAPYSPNAAPGESDADIKRGWYTQMLSLNNTQNNFPRLKAIIQFEEQKLDGNLQFQDWRVLIDPATTQAFKEVLAASRNLISYATDFSVSCGGVWRRK